MSEPKYYGYNEDDTKWDQWHRSQGLMTNREFFTSNSKGGFYEGMEWDGDNWVPNAESREREQRTFQREMNEICSYTGEVRKACQCCGCEEYF